MFFCMSSSFRILRRVLRRDGQPVMCVSAWSDYERCRLRGDTAVGLPRKNFRREAVRLVRSGRAIPALAVCWDYECAAAAGPWSAPISRQDVADRLAADDITESLTGQCDKGATPTSRRQPHRSPEAIGETPHLRGRRTSVDIHDSDASIPGFRRRHEREQQHETGQRT
jgi:hypothetical protein